MHGLSGSEDLIDPPVTTRPLPFSRAWLAAFVLALIAIGWVGAMARFDSRAVDADVDSLRQVVVRLESIDPVDESHLITRQFMRLETLTRSPASNGDDRIERLWSRVEAVSRRAATIDPSDAQAVRLITADLQAAAVELAELAEGSQVAGASTESDRG